MKPEGDDPLPRPLSRRLGASWPFRESISEGHLYRNLPAEAPKPKPRHRLDERPGKRTLIA